MKMEADTVAIMETEFNFVPPPEALVFQPGVDEFDDPISYISKIRPVAEKYGICRIIPPETWRPPFSVDMKKFTFNPRVQPLKELEATTRIKLMYLRDLADFWKMQGNPMRLPVVEKKVLDLYALKKLVEAEGGLKDVSNVRKWTNIASALGLPEGRGNGATIKAHYERWVLPYENFRSKSHRMPCRQRAVMGTTDDVKRQNSACRTFSRKLLGFWRRKGVDFQWPIIDKKAVDLFALHTAIKSEDNVNWSKLAQSLSLPEESASHLQQCYEKCALPFLRSDDLIDDTEPCSMCNSDSEEKSLILVCVICGYRFHMDCLIPRVKKAPKNDWSCYLCTGEKLDRPREPYGFDQSPDYYTIEQFGEMAVSFKEKHFGMPVLTVPTDEVEKEYWRLLSNFEDDTVVEYGADIFDQNHGMGFPTRGNSELRMMGPGEYAKSKWNLNNIPVIESSAYSYIGTNIPGVTIPWMYIGMCFSTFCWHIEDHWSYSINYLHWGEPKTWYGIPGSRADKFESVLKMVVPELFERQPDLLHDLSTTLNPNTLMAYDIPVFRIDQRAGEFVITFPRAYHAGFNQGFNFAEAVNFAPADWIPIGRACIEHYASLDHVCVFSHDELICKIAQKATSLDSTLADATFKDMAAMLKAESALRKVIKEAGVERCERVIFEKIPDDARQCSACKTTCFLSAVQCACNSELFCSIDFDEVNKKCGDHPSKFIFKYRYNLDELLSLIKTLHSTRNRLLSK